jgi:hypothetical protein
MYPKGLITFKVLMLRIPSITFLLLLISCHLSAQHGNGNEWIRYDQQYIKIPVAKDAIYRVPFADIEAAGLAVTDPEYLQLFHRGVEQSITVGDDYIEFYGRKNDGTMDKELYQDEAFQPHQYYNLFADTTAYFLTSGTTDGKRMQLYEEPNSGLTPEPYHYFQNLVVLTNTYAKGRDYSDIFGEVGIASTTFDKGEGWMGPIITHAQGIIYTTVTGVERAVTTGDKPILEMVITGRGGMQHGVDVYIGPSSRVLTTLTVNGFESQKLSHEIEWSDINASGELQVGVSTSIVNATAARVSVNYVKVKFPQETDVAGNAEYFFSLAANASGKSYIELKNTLENTRVFDITDPSNPMEIGTLETSTLNAVIRTETARQIFATATHIQPEVKPVSFTVIDPLNFNYIIITHPLLRKSSGTYADPVLAYAEYRASSDGGAFLPAVLNIEQIYDQFNFGEQSPLAIFHLMKFLSTTRLPDYLFIIGKGLDPDYDYFRKPELATTYKSLVPGAGMPASDMAFTAGLDGTNNVPGVATGRITAMTSDDVAAYLEKVKEAESRPFNDLRRKNVLHLSGGIYAGEAQNFRSYLQEYAQIAEGFHLGGKVDAIAKESTDIKLINISKEVNDGVNLVTFFGHSSAVTLDFDVGRVTDEVMGYHNKGKYPVLLMNGCQAGAFFRHSMLFGEDWINAPDRGAVGFIAHTSFGYVGQLRKYSDLFYDIGYGDSVFIAKGLGDIQKEVARQFLLTSNGTAADITQVQQMVLLGDPAVPLFGAGKPDYAVRDENLSISSLDEQPVTVVSDSFAINFIVRNFGQAQNTPLTVSVVRTLSDRSTVAYDSVYEPVLYADTLQFIISDKREDGFGNNTFEVRVDADNVIAELSETNNAAYLDYFIPANGTKNLYPANFSIVNRRDISFSFQHTDLHSAEREFLMEVDTVHTFDSPFLKSYTISAHVLARQDVSLPESDTLVYYWRTKLAQPLDDESRDWTGSSFTFIEDGPEGWVQAELPQYAQNSFEGIVADIPGNAFRFEETVTPVSITTFGAFAGEPVASVSILIDSAEYNLTAQGFGCRNNTINLIAFDRRSTVPYQGVRFQWFNSGGRSCGREPWAINSFNSSELVTGNNDDIIQYVDNIPAGDSVLIFNIGDASYEQWPEEAKGKLGELGISLDQINDLQPGEPVVIFARKGLAPGAARVVRSESGSPTTEKLEVSGSMTGRYTSGEMTSVTIGPALSWNELLFTAQGSAGDKTMINIFGVDSDGNRHLLADSIESTLELEFINAVEFPYIILSYTSSDDVNLTPAQLQYWMVIYEPVPEGLIFYRGTEEETNVREGEVWTGDYGFINVSSSSFPEELTVNYKIVNRSSFVTTEANIKIDSPAPGDTTLFEITVDTYRKTGFNDIEVFVNPYATAEQHFDNNIFILPAHLNVRGENLSPVLDVTFDGRYIEKEEFISSEPDIEIRLWDENSILLKTDTLGIDMFLAGPCEEELCSFQRINFSRPDIHWTPATASSDFLINFNPGPLPEGKYVFRVSASDRSGNSSGETPYEISFRISDDESVVISDPFPNPATEQINFNVTLTGQTIPDLTRVDFVTLNGELAKSLHVPSSALHIGANVLRLNLQDEFSLPSGIYIYRMFFTSTGKPIEKRGKISVLRR